MSEANLECVVPQTDPKRCSLSWAAKVVCSGVFVSGREAREAYRNSAAWMLLDREQLKAALRGDRAGRPEVRIEVDERKRSVTLIWGERSACARMVGDQGAVVVPDPDGAIHFDPVAVTPEGPDPATTAWPTGDVVTRPETSSIDPAAVARATEMVFANPRQRTTAFLVVHRGHIVSERYGEGIDRKTRLDTWSIGKSIGATIVARCMALGGPRLDDDDLFEEWRSDANDPRRRIRLRDLLQLSSGLTFSGSYGSDEDPSLREIEGRFIDHIYIYAGGVDSARFCAAKPAEFPPGTVGRYRNCDPILALRVAREHIEAQGECFLGWPQRALFDRLGIRGVVLETDPYGHFLITGHDFARARDLARLGLLYLNDGVWQGERLLPEGFVDFVRTPAPAWADEERGASFVLNRNKSLALPADAFWASGAGVNKMIVVPSLDLVIVRTGHIAGRTAGEAKTLNEALAVLTAGIEP